MVLCLAPINLLWIIDESGLLVVEGHSADVAYRLPPNA
jgi:hypothetical protein